MGAVQAQDYASAKWAVGLRMKDGSDAALDQALADGTIIRTHVMRPTWHFVTPADVRWMLALTAPRVKAALAYNSRRLGLDASVYKRCDSALAKALQGGKQLTRLELVAILKQRGIKSDNLGYLHILLNAELEAIICSGGRRGKQFTYALLDERVPHAQKLDRDEALAELTRRYFTSHGPATVQDFAWWSGLTLSDAKSGLELLKPRMINDVVDGQTYWYAASMPLVKDIPHTAWLLPAFDEYMVGYTDRTVIIDPQHSKKLDGPAGALLNNSLVIDGRIVGTWKRTLRKDAVIIELKLLTSLNKTQTRALDEAIDRYGRFLDLPATVMRS
jgi:Winged helix DNA-binding domain